MRHARRHRWLALAAVALAGVSVTACVDDSSPIDDSTVTVFGPYVNSDADRFAEVIADFEQSTGVEVAYTGSVNFVSDLRQRALGNQRPDVAIVPQPGVIDALIENGVLEPLEVETVQAVRDGFGGTTLEATPWNLRFAVPYRSNVKSLVWYRPGVFAENEWEVPRTLDELISLVDDVDAGDTMAPWCFSVFAGSATGWPATDWIEDLVLRRAGVDVYEQWAQGEFSWQTPEIHDAFREFRELVIDADRSAGGLRAVLQTEVSSAGGPLFGDSPGCAMYKQASFADDWFPSGITVGPEADVDYFVLPSGAGDETRLVTAGDAAVAFADRPNVDRFMAFLASADGGRAWADDGGFISRRTDVDLDRYYDDADAGVAALLQTETTTRFDASDMLPADVGSDLLWRQITDWINGSLKLDDLLASLDEALGIED
jgi:alpha-glucoside transport system substrate-binding protein